MPRTSGREAQKIERGVRKLPETKRATVRNMFENSVSASPEFASRVAWLQLWTSPVPFVLSRMRPPA